MTPQGTDKTDMSFRCPLPETRCQPCLSPVVAPVYLPDPHFTLTPR
jgi:hypothetical protein